MCTRSALELVGDEVPVVRAMKGDEFLKLGVLGGPPVSSATKASVGVLRGICFGGHKKWKENEKLGESYGGFGFLI